MSDSGDKKFELSDRRRQELRREGAIPKSHDVTTTTTLAVGLALMVWGGGMIVGYLREIMHNAFLQIGKSSGEVTPHTVGGVLTSSLWMWMALFVAAIALGVFVSQVAQVGLNFGDEALALKLEKLNPIAGLQQIFSLNKLTQTGQNLAKLAVIGTFAYLAMQEFRDSPVFARPVSLDEMGKVYTDVAWSLGWRIVTVLAILAGADFIWQRWKFGHDNRMTFEQVKEERRSMEASPEVIKKRRMLARKTSMRRMLENMKDATVVVTNPTHYAVALKYQRGVTDAPIIVAKGIRGNALRIKALAYDLRIAVREDRPLARGLYKYGRIDQPIPAIFYQGVATILAALYKQGFQSSEGYARPALAAAAEDDEIWNTEND
jgi:flagellar biosynthesis protein FlhB